jgi:hypothetical protein
VNNQLADGYVVEASAPMAQRAQHRLVVAAVKTLVQQNAGWCWQLPSTLRTDSSPGSNQLSASCHPAMHFLGQTQLNIACPQAADGGLAAQRDSHGTGQSVHLTSMGKFSSNSLGIKSVLLGTTTATTACGRRQSEVPQSKLQDRE